MVLSKALSWHTLSMNERVFKPQIPAKVVVSAVLLGIFLFGFVALATWHLFTESKNARMSGIVVTKEFVPAPERQITVGNDGSVNAQDKDGEYILTVEVEENGTKKPYKVWLDKTRYDALKVGDTFDVGPYLVRD